MKVSPLLDLFAVENLLSDEQKMVRDNVRSFARERFLPGVAEWYLEERFPDEMTPELGALGVFGAN